MLVMEERRSVAPWVNDPRAWGRIRLTERMWKAALVSTEGFLKAKWEYHKQLPNPSADSYQNLLEIRDLEKVHRSLMGLGEEKGWLSSSGTTSSSEQGPPMEPPPSLT